jgi:hypothetical protein
MPSKSPYQRGKNLKPFPLPASLGRVEEGSFMDFCKRSNIRQKVPPVKEEGNSHLS